ncbi:helix-turn-helix domain-containing protein [Hyphomicrobium sp.]|uniref:helix-turn-helix domain-containing protein n=1 Tax=Hyphomicrobium sp. TaxID=82 RepID=UPI000F942ED1|nr:helix-turn-helix domain-containing protein [Hyphomicrobium sp.]RUP09081.1 MAG: helix-turn-helix domain-containing protein [Hyphomicrobium sp.]
MAHSPDEALLEELSAIKKLLILQALASGYKQKQVAATLGVSEATLSRMLPKGIAKEVNHGSISAD